MRIEQVGLSAYREESTGLPKHLRHRARPGRGCVRGVRPGCGPLEPKPGMKLLMEQERTELTENPFSVSSAASCSINLTAAKNKNLKAKLKQIILLTVFATALAYKVPKAVLVK